MRIVRFHKLFKTTVFVFGLTVFLTVCFLFYTHEYESDSKARKLALMETHIRSPMNKEACIMPELSLNSPEIMAYYHPVKPINCGNSDQDWIICEQSECHVKDEIYSKYGTPKCTFNDLLRTSDNRVKYGIPNKKTDSYLLRNSDFVKVSCKASSGHSYFGLAAGVRNTVTPYQGRKQKDKTYYNVLILGFDSLSRNHFIRKLPKTYNYLINDLKSVVLKGYNIVGDGTPQALIPLLTGFTELELPDTRKRIRNSHMLEVYPFIWNDYLNAGYITSFNEDIPKVGTFNFRLNGFEYQPVDHYLRTFYVEAENILSGSAPNCIGHTPDHLIMLNYTYKIMKKYPLDPRFIFSFHGGLSHDDINLIGAADNDVLTFLQTLRKEEFLKNTILIVMADHGSRFSELRATLQGKQEERMPFFSFVLPESFAQQYPIHHHNLVENQARLVTPFDIHATLKHLLVIQDLNVSEKEQVTPPPVSDLAKNRAISLFDKIPANRSCYDAYIEPHWCSCLNWVSLDLTERSNFGVLQRAASKIIDAINAATKNWRDDCAILRLLRINWALHLRPKTELVNFKSSSDLDGYEPHMKTAPNVKEFFQLQIVAEPGDSFFEATVAHNLENRKMSVIVNDISRVNKYGSQADCILEKNPDLRKFCFCLH